MMSEHSGHGRPKGLSKDRKRKAAKDALSELMGAMSSANVDRARKRKKGGGKGGGMAGGGMMGGGGMGGHEGH